jgi:zinc protease
MFRKLTLFLAGWALAALAQPSKLPAGVVKGPAMGGITQYDFPNGLRVLLYPDGSVPKVTVNVTYEVGSRQEGYGETGMAHLLEHLDFIETTNGRQIKDEITARGASWNGSTNSDRTNYYETVPSSDENLRWALGLEADRMVNVKFTQKILDTEMTVVRNEFERGENSPQSILRERVEATAYIWHNYGKSTIGSKEDIERVPVERLAAFYKKFYQPDNAVLVIGGRFDETKALQMVAETLGKIPRPARKLEMTYTVEPPQDGARFVELRRVGTGKEVIIAYHGPSAAQPDEAALQVLAAVMSGGGGGRGGRGGRGGAGGPSESRLGKALVETKLAQSANMGFQLRHDPGLITVSASLNDDQTLDKAKEALEAALADVAAHPPTKEEVDRVRDLMLRGLEDRMNDPQQFSLGLSEFIAQGDWRLMFLEHDRLKDISPQDLVRVARLYFKPSNETVGYYIPTTVTPDRTVVPEAEPLAKTLANYKSNMVVKHAEAFDPTPANIETRLTRSKLANGMKLVLLNKETNGNLVHAEIALHWGDATSLKGRSAAAQFAGALLGSGTKTRTRQQIRTELEKLHASVNVGGGGGGGGRGGRGGAGGGGAAGLSGVTGSVTAPTENFVAALRIAAEELKEPLFPQEDFDRIKEQRIRALGQPRTEPTQLAAELLNKTLNPLAKDDARYTGEPAEQIAAIQKVTLDDVKKFYADFYGASSGELVVLGPANKAAVEQAAAELFGSWSGGAGYKPLVTEYQKRAAINQKIETPDKANSQFEAGIRFAMSQSDPDYPAMVLANYMFGGSITARMPDRIRNREGLSYGASSRLQIPAEGNAAELSGTVSENPANCPKVEFSFMDELKKTLAGGFTAEEVATAKKAYLDAQMVNRSQDTALVALLAQHEQLGRTMKWDSDLEARIRALTPAQISAAFKKHIDPAQVSIVKAGDFAAAKVYQ